MSDKLNRICLIANFVCFSGEYNLLGEFTGGNRYSGGNYERQKVNAIRERFNSLFILLMVITGFCSIFSNKFGKWIFLTKFLKIDFSLQTFSN